MKVTYSDEPMFDRTVHLEMSQCDLNILRLALACAQMHTQYLGVIHQFLRVTEPVSTDNAFCDLDHGS